MQLGASSISLTVKDLAASQTFYDKLGFAAVGGDADHGWLVLRGGTATIGLFHGMFERNLLTFNPGWGPEATPLAAFDDVRAIRARLKAAGLELTRETTPTATRS